MVVLWTPLSGGTLSTINANSVLILPTQNLPTPPQSEFRDRNQTNSKTLGTDGFSAF
jgi:hypothetical protein